MKTGLKHLLLTSALGAVFAPVAVAQDNPFARGRHVTVTERGQPEFDPEVIRAGSFEIVSSLLTAAEYNDNVFAQPANQTSDTVIRIVPDVTARSNWTVHALAAGVTVDHREYIDQGSETTTDYSAFLSGRLDATRNFQLTGYTTAGHATEPRYEPGSTNSGISEPAQNEYLGAIAGATFRTDRVLLLGQAGFRQNDYQSFYDFRDMDETFVSARASYAVSPDLAFFVQTRQTEYDYAFDAPVNRDGSQLSVQAGANFEFSAPFRGEISAGTVNDDKDDPTQPDTDGLSLDGRLLWFPTQLTTLTFTANAGITDPGIPQAISAKSNRLAIRADHELLRNVLLYGQVGFGKYEFEAAANAPGFAREDEYTELSTGVAYKINKHAHLEFGYRMNATDTTGSITNSFDQNILTAGLRIFP